ncbi:MAG TPA: immunoglobulin domain-containing protein [Candidatus Methylomirabilis sp.]|nr:immunoglobulin domain-containing protein [Candidatus Methylomirabilis sp.]
MPVHRKLIVFGFTVFLAAFTLAGCGGTAGTKNTNGGSQSTAPAIASQPASQIVSTGQTAKFSVTATGTPPPTYQWQKNGANIAGAMFSSYMTPPTTTADSGEQFRVIVSNSVGNITSNSATLTVNSGPAASSIDVVTYHYDNARTGQNLKETTLTPANVNSTKFGKLGELTVDGLVDAQPLYLSNVTIPNQGTRNVLYTVTEHGSVYAFDADSTSSTPLWKISALLTGEVPSDDRGCGQVTPEIGITATPVIDRTRGPHGAIYLIAMSKDGSGNYFQRLHALDLTTGAELFGGPATIKATYPSSSGNAIFDAKQYKERPGLLQIGGTIYTTWSSHCDISPYTSWVMGFDANTLALAQTNILNLVPNGNDGGIWMAGSAPAADSTGNIFFLVGNGDFDTTLDANHFPVNGNCGNCFVKLATSGKITLADYFTPQNTVAESNADQDLGSGGAIALPDVKDGSGTTRHLAVGAGKDAIIYVVDRDAMGKFNASTDQIYQEISGQLGAGGGVFSMPAYFNGVVYYGAVGDSLKAFPVVSAKLQTNPASQSANQFGYPGTTPSISANGTANAIVWAVENGGTAVLHAYDATNLATEFYNSNQAANSRDQFSGNKFITPMVANGKVFVGTSNSVAVFGLLP